MWILASISETTSIALVSSDVNLLLETKKFLSSNFDMKDLGEASFVLGIENYQDRRKEF